MTSFDRTLATVFILTLKLRQALHYQFARAFRRGPIRTEQATLSAEHEAVWTRTLRHYGERGHEPAYEQREDWT